MKISKHNKGTYVVVLTILLILSLTACAVDIPLEEFAPEVLPEITEELPDENIQEDFIPEVDDVPSEPEDQQEVEITDGYLEVHFIDVGQADAALVSCWYYHSFLLVTFTACTLPELRIAVVTTAVSLPA